MWCKFRLFFGFCLFCCSDGRALGVARAARLDPSSTCRAGRCPATTRFAYGTAMLTAPPKPVPTLHPATVAGSDPPDPIAQL